MNVSIIITFFQEINILELCLTSVIQNTNGKYEIIVVNDNPSINLDSIKKKYIGISDLTVFNMACNSGYAAACNTGVLLSKYDYIVLMDCDIIPQEGWLEELINTYNKVKSPGAISSKIIEADSNKLFGFGIGVYGVDIVLYKRHGIQDGFSETDRQFPMVSSGCMLIKKEIYCNLDGQDEQFFNADNDLDFTYRVHLLGKTNMISAKSIVYHRGHVSGNIRTLPFRQDSKALLFKKWGDKLNISTMDTLKELYKTFPIHNVSHNMILVSFSNSLFRDDYINMISQVLNINFIQRYDIKNVNLNNKIFIYDYLSWSICQTNISILYFVDDYREIIENYHWFENRCYNDAIFDKNGNSFSVVDGRII